MFSHTRAKEKERKKRRLELQLCAVELIDYERDGGVWGAGISRVCPVEHGCGYDPGFCSGEVSQGC